MENDLQTSSRWMILQEENMNSSIREILKDKKRIVIKIGSSSLTHPKTGALNLTKLEVLVREISDLHNMGKDVIVVSSGAIAVGRRAAGLGHRPSETKEKQACAAIGQARLMMIYQKLFSEYNQLAAQILMTKRTVMDNLSRFNALNTFRELLKLGAIPIVNENDTVSTYEMQFGDNDTLSAIAPFFGVDEPLKVTHLLFVNLVMDGLGAMMLGNEPAKEEYMAEAPRKRDESIVSKKMMGQILTMGIWLTVVSFIYLKVPFFVNLFANEEQHLTGYFVLFIVAALFNGFNVRDDGFAIFAGLNENKDFIKVFLIIIIVQALLVNAAIVPLAPFQWIGEMFSCVPFGIKGWIAVVLLACTMIPADMVRKLCVNK